MMSACAVPADPFRRRVLLASARSRFARGVGLACALVVWLLGVLAYSPDLHHEMHEDCGEEHHECVIDLFHQGADNPADLLPAPLPVPQVRAVALPRSRDQWPEATAPARLPPGRGPPAC
ncbi:MAG: hypothetical protein NDI75_03625 [Candidatus Didemnitutus sp.]|nr:hypothetical protein [Candidatus Didemnitutus sp.]